MRSAVAETFAILENRPDARRRLGPTLLALALAVPLAALPMRAQQTAGQTAPQQASGAGQTGQNAQQSLQSGAGQSSQNPPRNVPPLLRRPPAVTLKPNARAVLLDVIVTDRSGHPVHGLKASDFIVTEGADDQRLRSFVEHQAPVLSAPNTPTQHAGPVNTWNNAPLPADGRAAMVILLDGLDTPPSAQAYVREQLNDFAKHLQPGTPVAIFELDTRLRLIQGFTTDPEEVREAIKDREKILLSPLPRGLGYVENQLRFDVLSSALKNLGQYLQQRPGRKSLIWFTGALPFWAYDDGTGLGGSWPTVKASLAIFCPAIP